jgi:hypothetical protein
MYESSFIVQDPLNVHVRLGHVSVVLGARNLLCRGCVIGIWESIIVIQEWRGGIMVLNGAIQIRHQSSCSIDCKSWHPDASTHIGAHACDISCRVWSIMLSLRNG